MNEKIIYPFRKNRTKKVICILKTWNNKSFFDIRVFYRNEQNELKPTAKGIYLPIERLVDIKTIVNSIEQRLISRNNR